MYDNLEIVYADFMKVDLFISRDIEEPYAEIHSDSLTSNIQKYFYKLKNNP